MKVYNTFLELGIITRQSLAKKIGNLRTADSMIYRAAKNDMIIPIRKNFYVVKNLETKQSLLNKFEIASKITPSAYISNYSAFEYYGLQNQVFNEVYVASKTQFSPFVFENISYKYVSTPFMKGVENIGKYIRITTLERTVVDAINNLEKIANLEELLHNLQGINNLDFSKIKLFLEIYNKQFLFQKTGFLLELFQQQYSTPKNFLSFCQNKIGKSVRYLKSHKKNDIMNYNKVWQLYTPENLRSYIIDEWNNSPRPW